MKPVTSSTDSHFAVISDAGSRRLNPAVSELNRTAVTKSINILSNKTLITASTTLKMLTVSSPWGSTSATVFLPKQFSSTLKITPVTQTYPKVIQLTRKPAAMSVPPVTKLKDTARTNAPTVPPPTIQQSNIATGIQDITELLKYPVSTTSLPWMKVTRGKKKYSNSLTINF
jgi:hypothetical protein